MTSKLAANIERGAGLANLTVFVTNCNCLTASYSINYVIVIRNLYEVLLIVPLNFYHPWSLNYLILSFSLLVFCTNIDFSLTHMFPIHPFCTLWKHKKSLRFSDVFKGLEKGCIVNKWFKLGYLAKPWLMSMS